MRRELSAGFLQFKFSFANCRFLITGIQTLPKLPPAFLGSWRFNSLLIDECLNLDHVIIKCLFNVVFILACLIKFFFLCLVVVLQLFYSCPKFTSLRAVLQWLPRV